MVARAVVVSLLLAGVLLAGCSQEPKEEPAVTPTAPPLGAPVEGLGLGNITAAATATADDAFLVSVVGGPDAPLAAFEYRVPEGALREHAFFEGEKVLPLEVIPVTAGDVGVEAWMLAVFLVEGGDASLAALSAMEPGTSQATLGVPAAPQPLETLPEPHFLSLFVDEGDLLVFVVGARTPEPTRLAFLVNPLDSDPDFDDDPHTDAGAALGNRTAIELPARATGNGFQAATYLRINSLLAFGSEVRMGPIEVTDALPVPPNTAVTARDTTIAATYPDAGYSQALGIYFGGMAQGTYEASLDLHGTTLDTRGLVMQHFLVPGISLAELLLFGIPFYSGVGGGAGEASSELHLVVADVNYFELVIAQQLDLGATTEELTGAGSETGAGSFQGLLGNVPPERNLATVRGGSLELHAGGTSFVYPGLARQLEG